ncbi:chalcone isomerase family protein, partial [Rhodoferax sp.]|uniref:chalcone isomerase family protein n=1 Tax=Rhodoferax sp. TaxID=50421 RepID=UPI00374D6B84
EEMTRVIPDVKKGEHLTGVNRPGAGAQFYYQGKAIGSIADPEFARAFFAIWLDARTREPELRQSLIGSK